MATIRYAIVLLAIAVLFPACSKSDDKAMQPLLEQIAHGSESELGKVVYGYSQASTGAQQVLVGMLRPLRAPSVEKQMKVEATREAGRFTMLVVQVPWGAATQPLPPSSKTELQPIIVCQEDSQWKVVGYVLPFNDIFHHFRGQDSQDIMQLSQWWIQTYARPQQ